MKATTVLLLWALAVGTLCSLEKGARRRQELLERANATSNGLINFTSHDYK